MLSKFDKTLYRIIESVSKSKVIKLWKKYPMFTVYIDNDIYDEVVRETDWKIFEKRLSDARKYLGQIGFPSMHYNIVIKDLSHMVNRNTGGSIGGYSDSHYMAIGKLVAERADEFLTELITHEWAHQWMRKNSKVFKKAVKQHYDFIKNEGIGNIDKLENDHITKEIEDKIFKQLISRWVPMVERLFNKDNMCCDYEIYPYIIKFNKLSLKNADLLPHQTTLYSTAKINFLDVGIGEDVYMNKINNGWILGNPKNRSIRNEIIVKFEELGKYVNLSEEEFSSKINQIVKNLPADNKIRGNVFEKIKRDVSRALEFSIENIQNLSYKPDDESEKFISDASKILYPSVLKYLKRIAQKPVFANGNLYDKVWTTPANEKGISYTKECKRILNILFNKKMKRDIGYSGDLSGEKFNKIRETITNLVKWVDSYGMSNDLELWATGIESFFKLPREHQRAIVDLMKVSGGRELPNRRQRKENRSKRT